MTKQQTKTTVSKQNQKSAVHPTNALIEQYLPFATSIASKVSKAISSDVDFDDILCNARLGLLEAARRYDDRFNVDFKTFAYYRIKGAIYDGLRKTGWIPRSLYSKMKLEKESAEYFKSMTDKIMESAVSIKDDVDNLFTTFGSVESVFVKSLDGMEDFEVEDKEAKKDIEHKAEFQKIKQKMKEAIESLPEKERKLIKMYYFQNCTLQEIGDRLHLSKSWTCRLHDRALDLLLKKLPFLDPKATADLGALFGTANANPTLSQGLQG